MVLILLALALLIGIAFFQVIQGLFSAMIMAILTVLSAAAALGYYELLAEVFYEDAPAHVDAAALIALFVIPLLILRTVFDMFIKGNVVLGVWADRIGGGILGLITGSVTMGILMIALQMLPFGPIVFTYRPFDDSLQRDSSLAPFYCDQFTAGLMKMLSDGSLAGEESFGDAHDDILLEAFCARNHAGMFGRVDAIPTALVSADAFQAFPDKPNLVPWTADVPANPLLKPNEINNDTIVVARFTLNDSVIDSAPDKDDESDEWMKRWRLPATHFRMRTKDGRSFYPVAYLTHESARWEAHPAESVDGQLQIAKLIVMRPHKKGDGKLTVDWVYRIPSDDEPRALIFRRTGMETITAQQYEASSGLPKSTGALGRKEVEGEKMPRHLRRRMKNRNR